MGQHTTEEAQARCEATAARNAAATVNRDAHRALARLNLREECVYCAGPGTADGECDICGSASRAEVEAAEAACDAAWTALCAAEIAESAAVDRALRAAVRRLHAADDQ